MFEIGDRVYSVDNGTDDTGTIVRQGDWEGSPTWQVDWDLSRANGVPDNDEYSAIDLRHVAS